ncbi:MAG: type ISP restriction/modification enzyme [Nocardioidaceae bacterium]
MTSTSGGEVESIDGYRRIDNITDDALGGYRATYGDGLTKDDIFWYVYGLLHSPTYRETFAADLKKMLPRIPKARGTSRGSSRPGAGSANCTSATRPSSRTRWTRSCTGNGPRRPSFYRRARRCASASARPAKRERTARGSSTTTRITVAGIPEEAYRYMLGSRSAIEWIMDRYQVKTDKASGIVNDPNDWATEHDEPALHPRSS